MQKWEYKAVWIMDAQDKKTFRRLEGELRVLDSSRRDWNVNLATLGNLPAAIAHVLNLYGEEGWEVIGFERDPTAEQRTHDHYLLKRPKPE